jgi:hypothetical protein
MEKRMLLLLVLLISTACTTGPLSGKVVTPVAATATAVPTLQPTPTTGPEAAPADLSTSEEAILIQEPGPGSRVASPLVVRGMADSTFEQNLVVRLVGDDGTELGLTAVTIAAEMGQRGPFEATLPFTVSGEQQAFIQVFATSPRDGGVAHLNAVGVMLTDGAVEVRPFTADGTERIIITQPLLAAEMSGGLVQVVGEGIASFEQTLLVELLDENGMILASQPVIVNAPDLGQPSTFSAELPYSVAATSPGRVVVRDVSPAFGGDTHLASVEVTLSP